MSQYLILIYHAEDAYSSEQRNPDVIGGHQQFGAANARAIVGGNALRSTASATSIRPDGDDFAVTDGPFAEAKEALGGYYVVDAADLDEAIALAKQVPMLAGGVEVRPILELDRP